MPTEELARTGAMIRQFLAFVYRLNIRLIPHRLIPRLKSSSWKLAVPRPPAVSSDYINNFISEHVGFDQWKASTREHTGTIFTEEPRFYDDIITPRIASRGYTPR